MKQFLDELYEITDWLEYLFTREALLPDAAVLEAVISGITPSSVTKDIHRTTIENSKKFIDLVRNESTTEDALYKILKTLNRNRFDCVREDRASA